ncbi:uncharacterized protein LOC131257027 [Magnolia sinica]|uniref:uncharacterized protein LOC131257027 n=1 Tax=Magnolia sinica TaxID=86752 RepID=UPI00265911AD|nr:uncharacterized protein LOC131257027 [Magnolia sinica]
MALQLRSGCRKTVQIQNPSLCHLFSSSSSSNGGEDDKPPSASSYLSSIKASLRQSPPPQSRFRSPYPPLPPPKPSKVASLEEIRKNLSEFRRRSAAPPPSDGRYSSSPPTISFQDLYKSNVIGKGPNANADSAKLSFQSIRESIRQLRSSNPTAGTDRSRGMQGEIRSPLSLKALKESLKLKPPEDSGIGSGSLPTSIFGREMGEVKTEAESQAARMEFVRMYSYGELGEKLKKLRPAEAGSKKKKEWFSLGELNERLKKLREIDEKETEAGIGGVTFKDLRDSLVRLQNSDASTKRSSTVQRLAILGQLGGQVTSTFMLSPPKEQLVEKYFHPDNMSSAEKLKLELKRVRDEFKMSESDCGSSRVQVAQLTTKIKHLSSHLHKKDKHSRKGLQEMIQRRKKLLKYLRRTDWDSYCLVLSKLGLRDNPDYKN